MITDADAKIEQLFNLYGVQVRNYCARRLPNDRIEDALADVFAVAWRKIGEVPTVPGALPWLYGVAYRVVFHHWRQTGRQTRLRNKVEGLSTSAEEADVADVVVLREDCLLVRQAASRLRPLDQEVLRLAMWEEASRVDIADILGISQPAVNQRLRRARTNLAKEFWRLSDARHRHAAPKKGGLQ